MAEFTVATTLFSEEYAKCYYEGDNAGLVATDTQKNTVYVVAKRTGCETPENFAIELCKHFLATYPVLSAVEAEASGPVSSSRSPDEVSHPTSESASSFVRRHRGRVPPAAVSSAAETGAAAATGRSSHRSLSTWVHGDPSCAPRVTGCTHRNAGIVSSLV